MPGHYLLFTLGIFFDYDKSRVRVHQTGYSGVSGVTHY